MKYVVATLASAVLLASLSPGRAWASTDASVSGTVRDLRGLPQMGILVELLAPNASVAGRALTDDHGEYRFRAVTPGNYQLRASVTAILPALRSNLHLHANSHINADLTLAAIFQAGAWLPAEHRRATEPTDDWRWTLRSTGNRPLLRWARAEDKANTEGSAFQKDQSGSFGPRGEVSFLTGDGSFGEGGTHQVFLMNSDRAGGVGSVVRAKLGIASAASAAASVALDAGMQRANPLGGGMRMLVSFASHPEVHAASTVGLTTLQSAATELLVFGDLVTADVGTLFTAERLSTTKFRSAPYLRVDLTPSSGTTIEYRFATDRALQSSDDLDKVRLPEESLSDAEGRPIFDRALHQEVSGIRRREKAVLTVALYRDTVSAASTQGTGLLRSQDLVGLPLLSDPVTGTMRLVLPGYRGEGVRIAFDRELNSVLSAHVEGALGPALRVGNSESLQQLARVPRSLQSHTSTAIAGAVVMTARQTGTRLAINYRWQPARTLTQVDEFDTDAKQAYLTVHVRQRLWSGARRHQLSGVVDGSNLLAEGYQPALGPEGQDVFLSQMPRALQAGLTLTF